ncbi:lytic polysaccharide monooxygenase [Paenibacillus terricola]|nr:lytic polysaccharide monooxygenase [Paenibacillus terricola]
MTFQLLLKQQSSKMTRLVWGSGALLLLLACSLLFADRAWAHGWVDDSRADLCMDGVNQNCGAVQYEPWSVEGRGDFPEIGVPDGQITGGGKYEPLFAQTATRWAKVNMSGGPFTFHWSIVANHSTNRWDYYITKPGWDPNKPITRADLELFCRYEDNGAIPPNDVYHDCVIPNDREGYHVIVGVWDIFDTINAFYQAIDVNLTIDHSQPTTPAPGYAGDPNRFGAIRDWSVIRPYQPGEQVVYNGYVWQARWYTIGQQPGTNEAWQQVGPATGNPTRPGEPTALTATSGNEQVSLSWATTSGATSYTVKRSTVSGGPYTNVTTITSTSYTDIGLTNGTTYYYVVSASNSAGTSGNSTQASATPAGAATQAPAAPTGLSTMGHDSHVMLSWAASTGATSYTVKQATVSGGPYTNIATVTSTSYTDLSVTNGTTYYYVISASNSAGTSANSTQASATPTSGASMEIPAAPTGLTATAGNAQVTLAWTASSGATSYTVKRATVSGGPYTDVATVTTTSYVNTGLTNGTTYYYVVSASNSMGSSANSAQANASPTGGTSTTSSLIVQYRTADTNATDNQIKASFIIKNTGSTSVNLSTLKIRYYFTKDGTAAMNGWIDWAQVGSSNVSISFGSATGTNADTYVELSFTSGAGSIPAGGQSGEIQLRMAKTDWSNFNENNDYSYDGTKTSFVDWSKAVLSQNGSIVWGTAP